ncbi:hypothetical protein OB13_05395 [Pontibacter sp. HJ8]
MTLQKLVLLLVALALPLQALLAQSKFEFKEKVQLDGAKRGKVIMEMPAGVLQVKAESPVLAEANIQYGRADWKPQSTRTSYKQVTELRLKQPDLKNNNNSKGEKNTWNINLSKNTPLELDITVGAGESTLALQNSKVEKLSMNTGAGSVKLDLRGSRIKDLDVNAGVGEIVLDLRGNWDHSLKVDLSGGIGDVKLLLPKSTGIRLRRSGMGSLSAGNLQKDGNAYSNPALGKSKHTLEINVSGGLGSVSVSQED